MEEAKRKQGKFYATIGALEIYTRKNDKYIEAKTKLLSNVKKFQEERKRLLKGLKTKYFHLIMMKSMRNE